MDETRMQFWARKTAWSLREAAWLLCGEDHKNPNAAASTEPYNEARDELIDAVRMGDLAAVVIGEAGAVVYDQQYRLRPAAVIAWAGDRFPNFPLQAEIQPPAEAPLPKQRMQEKEILRFLVEAGYDPKRLPERAPGGAGPKAEARKALSRFSQRVFEKAWERLRDLGEIAGAD